jgi:hypothetical protein
MRFEHSMMRYPYCLAIAATLRNKPAASNLLLSVGLTGCRVL